MLLMIVTEKNVFSLSIDCAKTILNRVVVIKSRDRMLVSSEPMSKQLLVMSLPVCNDSDDYTAATLLAIQRYVRLSFVPAVRSTVVGLDQVKYYSLFPMKIRLV